MNSIETSETPRVKAASCIDCIFWKPWVKQRDENSKFGDCRKLAPRNFQIHADTPQTPQQKFVTKFPSTNQGEWCGQFQPSKPEEQWLQHAYEECLDQAVYLKKCIAVTKTPNASHEPRK